MFYFTFLLMVSLCLLWNFTAASTMSIALVVLLGAVKSYKSVNLASFMQCSWFTNCCSMFLSAVYKYFFFFAIAETFFRIFTWTKHE